MRPEDAAREVRRSLGFGDTGPCVDLIERIEDTLGLPIWLLQLPANVSGAYAVIDEQGFIFASSDEAPVRRRFTVAHEVGHHALGHGSAVDPEVNLSHDVTDPGERAANAFAAELLLPNAALVEWWDRQQLPPVTLETVTRLASTYGVSTKMTFWRLVNNQMVGQRGGTTFETLLPRIEDGEHLALVRNLGLSAWTDVAAAVPIGSRRNPSRLITAARVARDAELVSDEKLAGLLGVATDALDAQLE